MNPLAVAAGVIALWAFLKDKGLPALTSANGLINPGVNVVLNSAGRAPQPIPVRSSQVPLPSYFGSGTSSGGTGIAASYGSSALGSSFGSIAPGEPYPGSGVPALPTLNPGGSTLIASALPSAPKNPGSPYSTLPLAPALALQPKNPAPTYSTLPQPGGMTTLPQLTATVPIASSQLGVVLGTGLPGYFTVAGA